MLTIALWIAAIAPAHASAPSERRAPVAAPADATTLQRASELLAGSTCRERLIEELRTGTPEQPGCEADRRKLGRALASRMRFGFVERSDVQLWAIDLVLGDATRCREWPVRREGRAVLDPRDVATAGCRQRRHRGPVAVTLVDEAGERARLPALASDRDGRLRVTITEVDAASRAAGLGGLRHWRWIELGEGAWAGRIDLQKLHGFLADWHLRWVKQGRGVPGLFVVRHPEHAAAEEARALAVEARLARERADVDAVQAGRMSPRRFLSRHPGSVYRREVDRRAPR
jgi:hypothetical protein